MGKREIIVLEDDKEVYRGPEQRHTHNVAMMQSPRLLGLSPDTWIKVAGFLVAITLFYYRTDDFMKSQTVTNAYIMKFAQNSDAYHSSQTGQVFEQGKPVSWGRRTNNSGNLGIGTTAYAAEERHD